MVLVGELGEELPHSTGLTIPPSSAPPTPQSPLRHTPLPPSLCPAGERSVHVQHNVLSRWLGAPVGF